MQRVCRILAVVLALYIAFVTLAPLRYRPQTGHPQAERFAAYLVLGAVFSLAYPKQRGWIAVGVVAGSIALELGQLAVPGRDAGIPDVIAKALGGITGTLAVSGSSLFLRSTRIGSLL
jgi:VanZ family protein